MPTLKPFRFQKEPMFSMPHGKTQLMFMCPGLNVTLVEAPPSTNLQQDTQYPHGIAKSIIGVSTLIQGVNIPRYAQHGGTIIMD
jgi:hypothetical protein